MNRRPIGPLTLLVAAAALSPAGLSGQVRRGRPVESTPGWAPVLIGVRGGYDQNARGGGEVLGGQLQVPVLPTGRVALLANADAVFPNNAREYQYSLEAVVVTGSRTGGLYGGAGIGRRHSTAPFTLADQRTTVGSHDFVVGIRGRFAGIFQTVAEFRWLYVEGIDYRLTPVTLGVSIPLWGWGRSTS